MKKLLLLLIVVIVGATISVSAKSPRTAKQIFGDISRLSLPVDANGHIQYKTAQTPPQPWQSGSGVKKVLMLLLEFPDETHRVKRDFFEDVVLSDKRMSLKRYYNLISNERLKIDLGTNGIPDWMMMPRSYLKYIRDNEFDLEDVVSDIIEDGMSLIVKKGVNLSEYDNDGNGFPDITVFFFPGNSFSVGGYMLGDFTKTTDERTIVMVAEDHWAGEYNSPTLIHEMAHAMVPIWDLYDYSYTSEPVGNWDIMGSGSWIGHCGMSGYTRWKAGWTDIKWLDKAGEYEIDDLNGTGENRLYGISIPGSDKEWLLLENRQATGVEAFFNGPPGKGIAVYLVDDKRPYDPRFNTLTKEFKTHGLIILRLLGTGASMHAETSPSTLPYVKHDISTPNIGIRNVSKPGSKMTFTLTFDRPGLPMVAVAKKVYLGKIIKGTKKSFDVKFANIGIGTLHVVLGEKPSWLEFDRESFIGNEESISCTVDTTDLGLGKLTGNFTFLNKSTEAMGAVEIEFEVTPIHGDVDSNNVVDSKDFKAFMKLYGLAADNPSFKPEYDFNSDGVIDFTDLCLLAKNYRQ